MAAIDLTEAEMVTLHDVIRNDLSELHTEISHTDDRDFKAALRTRQERLQSVLDKISGAAGPSA